MNLYKTLLAKGERPEQARRVLPVSLYTTLYMGGFLDGWINFFRLRLDSHTQKETRELVEKMIRVAPEGVIHQLSRNISLGKVIDEILRR